MRRNVRIKIGIIVTALILTAVFGVGYYITETYTVKTVYVEGNIHYTEDEIKAIVMDGTFGNNSLYLSMKYKNRGIKGVPFVDVMDVSIVSPDTVRITVYEKVLTGYVNYMGTCLYFDKDGYVVESSSVKTEGVPQIVGLAFDHVVVGEALPVEDPEVFNNVLSVTKLLEKYDLAAEKIYFQKSGDITVYFDDVKVALGNDNITLEDKLMLLPELLPNLEGKSGTLQMENYSDSGGRYTFKPDT